MCCLKTGRLQLRTIILSKNLIWDNFVLYICGIHDFSTANLKNRPAQGFKDQGNAHGEHAGKAHAA